MPDPISSTTHATYDTCDPTNASCADSGPPAAPSTASAPVVTIDPVVITGDAGAQQLLRRYDSQTCSAQWQSAASTCPGIGLGVLNTLEGGPIVGIATALHASLLCGKELRAVFDCNEVAETLNASRAEVIGDCHDRNGVVKPGTSPNEIICEVAR
jgi:hypothetical protein